MSRGVFREWLPSTVFFLLQQLHVDVSTIGPAILEKIKALV